MEEVLLWSVFRGFGGIGDFFDCFREVYCSRCIIDCMSESGVKEFVTGLGNGLFTRKGPLRLACLSGNTQTRPDMIEEITPAKDNGEIVGGVLQVGFWGIVAIALGNQLL